MANGNSDRSRGNTGRSGGAQRGGSNESGGGGNRGGGSKFSGSTGDLSGTRNTSNVRRDQIAEQQARERASAIETGGAFGGTIGGIFGGPIGAPIGQAVGQFAGGALNPVTGVADGTSTGGAGGVGVSGQFTGGGGNRNGDISGGLAGGTGSLGGGIGGIVGAQTSAQERAIQEQRNQQALISGQLDPFRTAGTSALGAQQALLGLSGQEAQQQAFAGLNESAGQKFLRDRQEKALVRNAAATGGRLGGNVQTALQQQAVGFAQQDIDKQFGRLGQLSGQGLQATTSGGQFGAGTAANISNLRVGQGEARASGILGQQQKDAAETEAIANILGIFSDDIGNIFSNEGGTGFFD